MRVLLHICCGPCALMPLKALLALGHEVTGFFYNPNIHPLKEYLARRQGCAAAAAHFGVAVRWADTSKPYDSAAWMRMVHGREQERCPFCWEDRLRAAAAFAAANGYTAFSSSLLYSRRQQHEAIAALGEKVARESGVAFLYQDFRPAWQAGIDLSKELGLYRQQYCGCLYSENDRYSKDLRTALCSGQ